MNASLESTFSVSKYQDMVLKYLSFFLLEMAEPSIRLEKIDALAEKIKTMHEIMLASYLAEVFRNTEHRSKKFDTNVFVASGPFSINLNRKKVTDLTNDVASHLNTGCVTSGDINIVLYNMLQSMEKKQ